MGRDVGGSQQVMQGTSFPTYRVNLHDFAPATGAFDFLNISVPVTATVAMVLSRVYVAADATGASTMDAYLVRRTAANSGGTAVLLSQANYNATQSLGGSATGVLVPSDTIDQATQCVVNAYTANPASYGAGVQIEAAHITVPATATPGVPIEPWVLKFGDRFAKPHVIRPGQFASLSFGGQATPIGFAMYATLEWVEIPLACLF